MFLRRILFLLLAAIFLNVPLVCGDEKKLKIGCDSDWPPYEYKKDGKVAGYAIDQISQTLARMGTEFTVSDYPWKRAVADATSGKVDALFSASMKASRAEACYYPETPLLDSTYVFFIHKKNAARLKYTSYNDLKGHEVGVSLGYSYTKEFWDFLKKEGNFTEFNTNTAALRLLKVGRIDYFACEVGVGVHYLKEVNLDKVITYLPKPLLKKPYYLIFNKTKISKKFVDRFSDELKRFKESPEHAQLQKKYFGIK